MTIPEIQEELRRAVLHLRELQTAVLDELDRIQALTEQLRRRRFGPPPKRHVSHPVTPELRDQVITLAEGHPELTQTEIARGLGINSGRVSEILHGKRL